MKRTLTLIASLHIGVICLSAADLKPDPTTEIPESSKRPVVVTLDKSAIRNPQSAIPKADLPDGYELVTVAAAPLVTHPIMGCLDDRGRLFVGDATGVNWNKKQLEANPPNRILCLEDTDGDGIYDKSTIFADKMTFPQGGCWLNGSLYVCSPPSIWKLTDTDGDGVADKREEIVTGFEYTGNAADVHGPWLHPNGRLYWCHGRKGHKVTGKEGVVIHEGLASGIWSCKPDGSDVQWHSLGCGDNPVKVDFTPEGEIIGVQNLYYSQPRGDTIVHWLYGGVYERPDMMKAIEGLPRTLEHMPVMYNFGHVAVSGCCFWRNYTGSADSLIRSASSKGGAAAKDINADKTVGAPSMAGAPLQFMVTHFNTQRVVRMELTPDGATYKATENEFLTLHDPDAHFTDVLEDADGSLLVLNTGGWFRIGCPASLMAKPDALGAVYRVRKKGAPTRAELVKQREPDPWGGDIAGIVAQLLGDERYVVRNIAIQQVVRSGDSSVDMLEQFLRKGTEIEQHSAVWALARINSQKASDALIRYASPCMSLMPEPERAGVVMRDSTLTSIFNALVHMKEVDPRRFSSITAFSALSRPRISLASGAAVAAHAPSMPTGAEQLKTSIIMAFICDPKLQRGLGPDFDLPREHIWVRAGMALPKFSPKISKGPKNAEEAPNYFRRSLIVMDEQDSPEITASSTLQFLDEKDERLERVAARIVCKHPDWAEAVAIHLNGWLVKNDLSVVQFQIFEDLLGSFLVAPAFSDLVAKLIGSPDSRIRQIAYRVLSSQVGNFTNDAWLSPLGKVLAETPSPLLLDAIKKLKSDRFDEKLQVIASDTKRPLAIRLKALDSMKSVKLTGDTFTMVKGVLADAGSSAAARIQAAMMLANAPLDKEQQLTVAPLLASAGPVELEKLLALLRKPKDTDTARSLANELAKNPVIASQQESVYRTALSAQPPDVFETIVLPAIRKATAASDAKRRQLAPLADKVIAKGDPSAGRAVFESGKGTCIACHLIGGKGRAIGPDLSKIGAIRTERDLMESILFPSNTLARDYEAHIIETSDGQNIMGVIKSHTAEGLLVIDAAGQEKNIPHASIVANTTLNTSLMPMGLDQTLAEKELCDLVAWLRSLK